MTLIFSKQHWSHKELAVKLRQQGKSYNEIMKQVPVAKSTISLWCRKVVLTPEQTKKLGERRSSLARIKVIQKNFWKKRCQSFFKGVQRVNTKLTKQERFFAGLMLYWAEGNKQHGAGLANSDPEMVIFIVQWFKEHFRLQPCDLAMYMHLHTGQNEEGVRYYWSNLTGIPLENFRKTFFKPEGSGYRKNKLHHGTVTVRAKGKGSTYLLFQILGAIAGVIHQSGGTAPQPENWMERLPYA